MNYTQNYYEVLGVNPNDSIDIIKRAYVRKRREYQGNEEMTLLLTEIQRVLVDPDLRMEYDKNIKFEKRLYEIDIKINKANTYEELKKNLIEKKKICFEVLELYPNNVKTLLDLAEIEEHLGNNHQALEYLRRSENFIAGDEKIKVYQRIVKLYEEIGDIDSAINYGELIYKTDVIYVEDIRKLARFLYENKQNIKGAILVLSDCVNRCTDSRYKIIYLCEILRAIRKSKNSAYKNVEESMYKKLKNFGRNNEGLNRIYAAVLLVYLADTLDENDFECFHKFEEVFNSYNVDNTELINTYENMKKIVDLNENGTWHKAINLYLGNEWNENISEEFAWLLIKEADKIKTL